MEELRCPFTSALNPGTEAAHHQTSRWAERLGLIRDPNVERQVATEQFTWLVGRFFPWAPPRELELISDFTSWLFWHDDVCDETALGEDPQALAQQFDALFAVLTRRQPVRPGQAFDLALGDLRDRFEACAPSPAWFARFVTSVRQYFDGCVWEAANRREGAVPSVDAFISMRRFACGMYIYIEFIELAMRAELPLIARAHHDLVRLAEITNHVAAWHNDLFSLSKELAHADVHNLVVVVARQESLSIGDARARVVARCNEEVEEFQALARRLPSFGAHADASVAELLRGLGALMRGNLDWSLATRRYHRAFEVQAKAPHAALATPALVPPAPAQEAPARAKPRD
jgi:hypothetical protein